MKNNINKLVIAALLICWSISGCDRKLEVVDKNSPTQAILF
jgi:predicted small lipoprotein YifL